METVATSMLAARNAGAGKYWFDPGTRRFFRSRIAESGYRSVVDRDVVYFVTSERRGPDTRSRAYSVRRFRFSTAAVDTVGDFLGFDTRAQATARAKYLAKHGEND